MAAKTKKELEQEIKNLKEEKEQLIEAYKATRLAYVTSRADFLKPLLNMSMTELRKKVVSENLTIDEGMALIIYIMPVLKNLDYLIEDNNNEKNS